MATVTRQRTGGVYPHKVGPYLYWEGRIRVDGRIMLKHSKSRAVCEAWRADMVAAHPTYVQDTNRKKALETWRRRNGGRWARHVIALETNPHTASLHFHVRHDWPLPRRVITTDIMNESIPIAWLADDNGGGGYTHEGARRRAAQLPSVESASYTIRRMDTLRYVRTWDR